ncbi:MarR family winged helix-turn-helix transcriptional regulator [Paenalcaligenes hominis]|uniref:MarR family winged helix-turn-helix transcriptional regulator n=1 Tax=Paenalcaligenes hominis TaxID=643674 RepID=UPI00352555E8
MTSTKKLDLERYTPALLTFIANKLSSGSSQLYRERFNIGIVEWRVLSMLVVESHIPAQRVCQVIGLDKSAVSKSVQTLQTAGYIQSEPDKKDARKQCLSLTAEGYRLHDEIFEIAQERERRLLKTLTPEEREIFVDILNRLHSQIDYVNEYRP